MVPGIKTLSLYHFAKKNENEHHPFEKWKTWFLPSMTSQGVFPVYSGLSEFHLDTQKWRLAATKGTTHVPLEGANSDAWRRPLSSQTHKVASANIGGKKKSTYLKINRQLQKKRQLQIRTLIQLQKLIFTNVTSSWISHFLKRESTLGRIPICPFSTLKPHHKLEAK